MRKAWLISLSNVGKVEGKYLSRLTELALCKQHRFFFVWSACGGCILRSRNRAMRGHER